ncbi:MAG TPA: ROK family protein [Bacteroidales bacterium]|nr:ROK family protein [Bacteroidales bacterium]
MSLLGIDLGGTKLSSAIFSEDGTLLLKETVALENRRGKEVGLLITDQIGKFLNSDKLSSNEVSSIGISVPGISHTESGTVWAPNIPGWDDYPLSEEVKSVCGSIPVSIDSDRACYMLGELWQGNARGCRNAVFLAVGTGIGAGILVNGEILRGSHDIAGAIGWMALNRPFDDKYISCGCFEYYASGEGVARVARDLLKEDKTYSGELKNKQIEGMSSYDVFSAFENGDYIAQKVIGISIEFWGMAVANLVSLFNPEKVIMGGGVFGPAVKLIPAVKKEAEKWAQPISIKQVDITASGLAGDAGVFGAGYLASKTKR